jgi:hypothetical protein
MVDELKSVKSKKVLFRSTKVEYTSGPIKFYANILVPSVATHYETFPITFPSVLNLLFITSK